MIISFEQLISFHEQNLHAQSSLVKQESDQDFYFRSGLFSRMTSTAGETEVLKFLLNA